MDSVHSSQVATSDDPGDVAEAILTASRVPVAVAARSLEAVGDEITLPQFRALVTLDAAGSHRPVDLAEKLGISPSTATRLCDRLVLKGLIDRRRHSEDRREVKLELTQAGRTLVATEIGRRRADIERIVANVPPRHRRDLVGAFQIFGDAAGDFVGFPRDPEWDL